MDYKKAKQKIYALGLNFDKSHLNRVLPHNKNETNKHYFMKCLLIRYFLIKDETTFCEYPIGRGIFDVFNLDRMACFEIETTPSSTIYEEKRALLQGLSRWIEVIIIDPKNYSNDFIVAIKQLSENIR